MELTLAGKLFFAGLGLYAAGKALDRYGSNRPAFWTSEEVAKRLTPEQWKDVYKVMREEQISLENVLNILAEQANCSTTVR